MHPSTVLVPFAGASLRGVRWRRHRAADQGPGARLSPAGGHARPAGGHDGEGQDRPGLLQVRPEEHGETVGDTGRPEGHGETRGTLISWVHRLDSSTQYPLTMQYPDLLRMGNLADAFT